MALPITSSTDLNIIAILHHHRDNYHMLDNGDERVGQ
jgi:hypothetical protein